MISLKKVIAFLRGGSSEFNDPEMLLQATLDSLPKVEAEILAKQIEAVSIVQRQHPGRLVVAYYPKIINVPQLPYLGYEYCISKVTHKSAGKIKTTNLVLHEGRFMTFEGNVPLKEDKIESIVKVVPHPSDYNQVAEKIDTEEHGTNA
ncbi:hypothetical protein ACFPTX_13720 [Pseudomonas sp. GCM10022188]|uniref:hypothetical protein n=1 Tax=Pseudomonas TaxID=286 RepID=UPI001E5AFD1A|nr:hypothetical protein [Pseudomonas oryzagri]MCC6074346.1 hypothetical protein [Pseudomonas oryzagri]